MTIPKDFLDILACPQCKSSLEPSESQDRLICRQCRVYYEIRDGIPILLVEEAKPLDSDE
jgi:hypothetical protein